jgi:hypothetical protein
MMNFFYIPRSLRVSLKGSLLLAFVFGNILSGCVSQAPPQAVRPEASAQAASPSVTPSAITTPRQAEPIAATPASPRLAPAPGSPRASALRPDPNNPDYLRDYNSTTPLPETGRVTVRADIASFALDRLITDCPTDTALYAFAESSNYRIQVCSEEYDPWLPKYYIGRAKEGGDELRLINKNTSEAQQLIFRNGDYIYTLYRDGARPERINAYLEIYSATDRKTYAEALVYLYEKSGRR